MNRPTITEALARFIALEDATKERVYVVCENRRALKVLAAWSSTVVHLRNAPRKLPEDDNAAWEKLWQAATVSYDNLATMTALSEEAVKEEIDRLRLLRLVYPDGTINKWAKDAVTRKLFEAIGVKPIPRNRAGEGGIASKFAGRNVSGD